MGGRTNNALRRTAARREYSEARALKSGGGGKLIGASESMSSVCERGKIHEGGVAKASRPDQTRHGQTRPGQNTVGSQNTAHCVPYCGRQTTPAVTEHRCAVIRRPPHLSDPSDSSGATVPWQVT